MKRWILGFVVFPIALFISLFAFHLATSEDAHIEVFSASVPTASSLNETAFELDFDPEFTNLPGPYAEFPEWNERFIDTYQVGNVFRESETVARQGQSWFVLFERDDKYEVVKTRAKIQKLSTYSWGDERDAQLSFDKPGIPIFAVRNFKSIRPGQVTTLFQKPSFAESERRGFDLGSMKSNYHQEFFLDDKKYILRVSNGLSKDGHSLTVLVLDSGAETQVVFSDNRIDGESALGKLLWVGDLDHDDKLDFLIEPYSKKGGYSSFLFISSEAERGNLVKFAAAFGLAGC